MSDMEVCSASVPASPTIDCRCSPRRMTRRIPLSLESLSPAHSPIVIKAKRPNSWSGNKRKIRRTILDIASHKRSAVMPQWADGLIPGLPDAISTNVMKYVSRFDMCFRSCTVNKQWKALADKNCMWKRMFVRDFDIDGSISPAKKEGVWKRRYKEKVEQINKAQPRTLGWANYIDNHLVKEKTIISRACIFGYKGGVLLWDKSKLFRIKDSEMNDVVACMQDMNRGSLIINGTKYIVTVNDGDSLYLRSCGLGRPPHGLVCAKTMRAIVTAQYEGYRPQAVAAEVVECLADYLVDQSY